MSNLNRCRTQGQAYFFTLALQDKIFDTPVNPIKALCLELLKIKLKYGFNIDALVILPRYLQGVLTLPEGAEDCAPRWRQIMSEFSVLAGADGEAGPFEAEAGWPCEEESRYLQRRFFGYLLQDENDFARHVHYLHFNPVKQGLVKTVSDWPYSTFFPYVQQGVYALSWGAEASY